MERGVKEGEEAQQPAELDEPAEARRKAAHWRDGQRDDEQAQRGQAGGKGDGRRGISAQFVVDGAPEERAQRPKTGQPGEGFECKKRRSFHSVCMCGVTVVHGASELEAARKSVVFR